MYFILVKAISIKNKIILFFKSVLWYIKVEFIYTNSGRGHTFD